MFSGKLEVMRIAIRSSLGIDMFCFANRDLLAIRCWLTRPVWWMTAYAVAQVPMILELANTCISIAFKGVSGDGIDRGTLIFDGYVDSHFSQTLITWFGIILSDGSFNSQSSRYTTFPCRCTGKINPRGSQMDANLLRISRLVCLPLLLCISMAIESSFLSQNELRIFVSDGWVPSCLAYVVSLQSSFMLTSVDSSYVLMFASSDSDLHNQLLFNHHGNPD